MTDLPARRTLLIGTRSSPMALAQAARVTELLRRTSPESSVRTVPVTTSGDTRHGSLARAGGKGLFVKEIDRRLQLGEVDVAVHCLKDVPGDRPLPEGLVTAAMLSRDDVHDVLLVPRGSTAATLDDLPAGATVATSAVRRRAQLLALRPDLRVTEVRGAVATRLEKLDGLRPGLAADAMVLARAGLARLGLTGRIRYEFTLDEVLPAVGSGVLTLQCRRDDEAVAALLRRIDHVRTHTEASAERSLLNGLRGHCNSPVAAHCVTAPDGRLTLRARVFTPDGAHGVHAGLQTPGPVRDSGRGLEDAAELGARVCAELLRQGARTIIDTTAPPPTAPGDREPGS